jgi:hypothetical protein
MRTTLLLVSGAALLFMTACQSSLPPLPGQNSDPFINVAVNATVGLEDTIVQVPASVAANVCGVDVNVLTKEANTGSTPTCTATSSTTMEQLQPYAQEGQLRPTTASPTTDATGQQSAPQQDSAPNQGASQQQQQDSAPGQGASQQQQQQDSAPDKSEETPK